MTTYLVHPGSRLDWAFSWTSWLNSGDTISSYSWAIYDGPTEADGITLVNGASETVTVPEGLTSGKVYKLRTSIVTTAGLKQDSDIVMRCA